MTRSLNELKRSHADTADSHLKEIKKLKNPYSRLLYNVLLYVRCSAVSAMINLMVFLIYVVLRGTFHFISYSFHFISFSSAFQRKKVV